MGTTSRLMTAALVAASTLGVQSVAHALPPGGDENEDGYGVNVQVDYSGDAAPGNGGSYTVQMPVSCWWSPIDYWPGVDPGDPEAIWEYFQDQIRPFLNGHAAAGAIAWPDTPVFLDAIEREENGEDLTWYHAQCTDPDDIIDLGYNMGGETEYFGDTFAITNWPFVVGDAPEPAVDPEDLAEAARDAMVIEEPQIDRNPEGAGGFAGATLVNFPTWFWVTNPGSVGGADGVRTIRAEVVGGDVWAEVTARTGGLSIASPVGSRFCEPALAMTPWVPGAADEDGCTVSFTRASVLYPDGYPVSASTQWSATWEGQNQDGAAVGGDLAPLSRNVTVDVPVAEIQTLVQRRA